MDETSLKIAGLKEILELAEYGKEIRSMLESYTHKTGNPVEVVRRLIEERKQMWLVARSYGANKDHFKDPLLAVRCLLADLSGAEQEFPKWLEYLGKIKLLDPEAVTKTTSEGESWYVQCGLYITNGSASYGSITGWAHSEPEAVYLAWKALTNLKPNQYIVKSTSYREPKYRWNGNEWEITHDAK